MTDENPKLSVTIQYLADEFSRIAREIKQGTARNYDLTIKTRMLPRQANDLVALALQQEAELERLQKLEQMVAVLQAEMAELKAPAPLDKSVLRKTGHSIG